MLLIKSFLHVAVLCAAIPVAQCACQPDATGSSSCSDETASLLQSKVSVDIEGDSRQTSTKKESQLPAKKAKVVFGLMTSPTPKYAAQLKAVEETWAKDAAPQTVFVIGNIGSVPGIMYDMAPMCEDGNTANNGLACKESTIVARGHELGADWVVVGGTDQYIFTESWQTLLDKADSSVAQVLGMFACGGGKFCEDGQDGLCGGAGYAISRAALEKMVGRDSQRYIKECMTAALTVSGNWSDQAVSCVARRHHIKQVPLEGLYGCKLSYSSDVSCRTTFFDEALYEHAVASDPPALTMHYIFPDDMHKIHKIKKSLEAEMLVRKPLALLQSYEEVQKTHVKLMNAEMTKHVLTEAVQQSFSQTAQANHRMLHVHDLDSPLTMQAGSLPKGMFQIRDAPHRTKLLQVLAFFALLSLALPWCLGLNSILTILLAVVYVLWSSALIMVNSFVVQGDHYVHPLLLVTLHMLSCSVTMNGLRLIKPHWFDGFAKLQEMAWEDKREALKIILVVASCFAISLVAENAAYWYASVSLLQMIKETGLVLVAWCAIVFGLDSFVPRKWVLLLLIAAGGIMCVRGEPHFVILGPALQLGTNFCTAMRLSLQNKLLVRTCGLQLDPLSYVALVSPFCFGALIIPAIAVSCTHQNLLSALRASSGMITVSCTLAVGLNLIVAVLVQRVSAVGFTLIGSLKTALIILSSVYVLDTDTSMVQILGCALVFSSVTSYAVMNMWEKASIPLSSDVKDQISK